MNLVDVKGGIAGAASAGHDDSSKPHRLDAAAIAAKFAELKSSEKGLTSDEAKARLAKDGPNAIVAKEEPLWHKLFGYFWGPIPWMIEAAAIISLLRSDWPDFFVVTGLLIYNAAVGFWQDAKAASALAPRCAKVWRSRRRSCATANGRTSRRRTSSSATSLTSPPAKSCLPTSS
jgi:magnesium-transporting ATPase (P-type)